jgi:hypothetical protein
MPANLVLRLHCLCLPKSGHTVDEYEDAWAADPAKGRFAVADGAAESSFASRWARLLTEGFLDAERMSDLTSWLPEPRRRWATEVMGLALPWYAEMKREQGAYATFLGLCLLRDDRGEKWRAIAVGDSCLIRVQQTGAIQAFPLGRSADFGNQPLLIGSHNEPVPAAQRATGSFRPGDRLLLMTDALAQWFLHRHEQGRDPWASLAGILSADDPNAAFSGWISDLRECDGLRNDDVTLLAIERDPRPEE